MARPVRRAIIWPPRMSRTIPDWESGTRRPLLSTAGRRKRAPLPPIGATVPRGAEGKYSIWFSNSFGCVSHWKDYTDASKRHCNIATLWLYRYSHHWLRLLEGTNVARAWSSPASSSPLAVTSLHNFRCRRYDLSFCATSTETHTTPCT